MSQITDENALIESLKHHGVDVYAGGTFESLRDRLAQAIVDNRYGMVICGRNGKKPETYEAAFERIFGAKLKDTAKKAAQARKAAAR